MYVKGERKLHRGAMAAPMNRTNNSTALRIIFTLLCRPEMANASYREIVGSAEVSLGTVSRIFDELKRRGYLTADEKRHGRKLLDPMRLLNEWVTNYPVVLRPKLHPRRFSAPSPGWWKEVRLDNAEAVWGGEIAAERLTNYLKPVTQTLYVSPKSMNGFLNSLISTYRLKPDPDGPIEILERFWNIPADPRHSDIAPPILIYADLMNTLDPRNIEVATIIREKVIADAFHQT